MLKFRGFRASLHIGGKKQADAFDYYTTENLSMSGAYRANREEFNGNGNYSDTRTRITPEMVKLPSPTKPEPTLRISKSTNDLLHDYSDAKLHEDLQSSASNISMNPRGAPEPIRDKKTKKQERESKKIEKQRAIEKAKKETQEKEKKEKKEKKSRAPKQPPTAAKRSNPMSLLTDYDTAKSVSRTSGPPPYDAVPDKLEVIPIPNHDDEKPTGNIKFSKPIEETSSWDLVSQHREQMDRPVQPERKTKKTVMDLNFKIDLVPEGSNEKINSEA